MSATLARALSSGYAVTGVPSAADSGSVLPKARPRASLPSAVSTGTAISTGTRVTVSAKP